MKKFFFYLLLLPLSLFVASSCSDSDDDKWYVSLVTVTQGDGKLVFMRSDSSLLNPTNLTVTSNVGQRVLIEYEIKKTFDSNSPYKYDVEIEDYDIILTKDAIDLTTENETTVGNDAFWRIFSVNSGGGYLNVYMSFLYNYVPHTINLVDNKITPAENTPDKIYLELRQNANGANSGFPVEELVSFNVQKYIDAAKDADVPVLTVVVSANLPNNETTTFTVKFNTGAPNTEEGIYTTLDVYAPQEGATN